MLLTVAGITLFLPYVAPWAHFQDWGCDKCAMKINYIRFRILDAYVTIIDCSRLCFR
jgi:hypothetical protein